MVVTASALRQNVYALLDKVIETGAPLEINRRNRRLRITPVEPVGKLSRLRGKARLKGNPDDIVHMDWSREWKP